MSNIKHLECVITFKADATLMAAMKRIPNRSEFIRAAILAALDSHCPLCGGTGVLTPRQKTHWEIFAKHHLLRECQDCHEVHLVCEQSVPADASRVSDGESR